MEFGVIVMRNCRNHLRDVCMSVTKEINRTARCEVLTDVLLKSSAFCSVKQRCRASTSGVSKGGVAFFFRVKQAVGEKL